jgi:hypothetical protein
MAAAGGRVAARRAGVPPPRAGVLAFTAVLVLSITLPQGVAPSASKQDRCVAALEAACGADHGDIFKCAQCSGIHQKQLQAAGCDNKTIVAWCAGIAPTPSPAGSFFPGSRIVSNATWAGTLNDWMPPKAKGKSWALCFSSFTENATTPITFHAQCDQYNTTLIMVINSLGFTFGAYVRPPHHPFSFCVLCSAFSSLVVLKCSAEEEEGTWLTENVGRGGS